MGTPECRSTTISASCPRWAFWKTSRRNNCGCWPSAPKAVANRGRPRTLSRGRGGRLRLRRRQRRDRADPEPRRQALRSRQRAVPGAMLGELGLISGTKRPTGAVAKSRFAGHPPQPHAVPPHPGGISRARGAAARAHFGTARRADRAHRDAGSALQLVGGALWLNRSRSGRSPARGRTAAPSRGRRAALRRRAGRARDWARTRHGRAGGRDRTLASRGRGSSTR